MNWQYLQTTRDEAGVRSLFKDESGNRHLDFTSSHEGGLRIQMVTQSTGERREFLKETVAEIGADGPLVTHLETVLRATGRIALPVARRPRGQA